jgi:hypothetical protein
VFACGRRKNATTRLGDVRAITYSTTICYVIKFSTQIPRDYPCRLNCVHLRRAHMLLTFDPTGKKSQTWLSDTRHTRADCQHLTALELCLQLLELQYFLQSVQLCMRLHVQFWTPSFQKLVSFATTNDVNHSVFYSDSRCPQGKQAMMWVPEENFKLLGFSPRTGLDETLESLDFGTIVFESP